MALRSFVSCIYKLCSLKKDQTKTIPSLTIVKNANASQNDKYKKPTYEN